MLGRAFDVTARGKPGRLFEDRRRRVYENTYEIEVKNAKAEPIAVTLREFVPGDWEMLEESSSAREARFRDRRMAIARACRRQRQADLQGADYVLSLLLSLLQMRPAMRIAGHFVFEVMLQNSFVTPASCAGVHPSVARAVWVDNGSRGGSRGSRRKAGMTNECSAFRLAPSERRWPDPSSRP